ncbi:aldolase/citrate lyase family protein [Haladaptatus sp. DYF46]|uniref:HpcH/HpaI aldolase family protein n=1 Tax=Haladaptatus sp. DYF46 TaxID=2886041 RepID=UPI001E428670|nr:aldolase/citrate lyase family protein [Haladaptatus sp. DYF46]
MSTFATAVRTGVAVVGSWISIGHPAVAEMSAELGFDFVVIDAEHTSMSLETVETLARAVDAASGETEPLVRVADDDPARLKRVLDTGVSGVIVPMVETEAQARGIADATRYPPEGVRGVATGTGFRERSSNVATPDAVPIADLPGRVASLVSG